MNDKSLKPCACGESVEVMVNSAWEVFVMCPRCARKGKTIKPPFGKASVDDFMTYLEDAENEAVDSWNKGDCAH